MTRLPPPEAPRRGEAVRLACGILIANEVRLLPPDAGALARGMGFHLIPFSALRASAGFSLEDFTRHTQGEEAFTLSRGGEYYILWDDGISSAERIRFSVYHEFGHILMRHFESWNLGELTPEANRVLEEEANVFARNILCPPPILDLARGERADPRWARLFCLSGEAWRVRVSTLAADRRCIDQQLADRLRLQFREYMFGRRCRECGLVFTDETRLGRCPGCGCRHLKWNPAMESREEAAGRRHMAGAAAVDLKPRLGEEKTLDLAGYWELVKKEERTGKS